MLQWFHNIVALEKMAIRENALGDHKMNLSQLVNIIYISLFYISYII